MHMLFCHDSHRYLAQSLLFCSTMRLRASWSRPSVTVRDTGNATMTNDTSFASVTGATSSLSKAFNAYCSNNCELQSAFVSQSPQPLVIAVEADANEIGQQRSHLMEPPLDPCEGRSEQPPVSLQEQQVTSSDPLQGQSAMPPFPVPGQQADSDGEAMAFFATGPVVIDQERDERVWATLDEGCNAACYSAS